MSILIQQPGDVLDPSFLEQVRWGAAVPPDPVTLAQLGHHLMSMPAEQVRVHRVYIPKDRSVWFVLGSLFTPGEGGTMALWWREPGTHWQHIQFQSAQSTADLAARHVPAPPPGFLDG